MTNLQAFIITVALFITAQVVWFLTANGVI